MNTKEKQLLLEFLEDYSERLSTDGCNDFYWPPDWSMEERLNFCKTANLACYEDLPLEEHSPIHHNGLVLYGLMKLLKAELNLDTGSD